MLADSFTINETDKKELLSEISKASLRLNQQVENLLNTSRIESGFIQAKKEWCDLNEIISSAFLKFDDELKNFVTKNSQQKNSAFIQNRLRAS